MWELEANYDFNKIEEKVLDYWMSNKIRQKVLKEAWEKREGKPIFSFLEGPPTTNGYMHAGHARGRIYKDIMVRYHILKGYRVWAQGGWDTQGLPVELEVEKKFKVKSKREIEEKIGVEKFIDECRKSVDHYIAEWVKDNERLAVWLDYENAYETRHPLYLETVWKFIKRAHERGLLYKSYSVVPRCPRCGTALSNHELSLGSEVVKDPSFYFKVKDRDGDFYYLVWTTTPWTIIANRALAVNPEATYVLVEAKGQKLLFAEALLPVIASKLGLKDYSILKRLSGKELEGRKYVHPLEKEVPANRECSGNDCTVVLAEYVTTTEGTGIVHTAPAHGPEDFETAHKYKLTVWTPLRENGYFGEDAGEFAGLWFKVASEKVIESMKRNGSAVLVESIEHEYPHCWRCGTPLVYYPTSQWFIRTTAIVKEMRDLLKEVKFRPTWGYNRMDSWVESSRDWCISRERYWGTPLPVWVCEKCGHVEVFGSLEELKRASGEEIKDPHKPYIDQIKLKCPKCGSLMKREPFVLDVWADSGVAHTAELNQLRMQHLHSELYPYSFALEPPEQVRGWFYTLLITSTVLHDKAPYKMLGMHGLILDSEGQKMSKSKGNVVFGRDAMRKHGSDQLRLFMSYRNSPWQDIRYVDKEISEIGGKLRVIYNVAKFLVSYAELDGWKATDLESDLKQLGVLDKWALTKLNKVISEASNYIENFDLHSASKLLYDFLVEDISRSYVVAIRPRVWTEEDTPQKRAAYATLFTIFKASLPMMAIFTPYIAEYLYQSLYRKLGLEVKESVMLERIEPLPEQYVDESAYSLAEELLGIAEAINSYRGEKGIKRRLPMKKISIMLSKKVDDKAKKELEELISTVANVMYVEFVESPPASYIAELSAPAKSAKAYIIEELDEESIALGSAREVVRRIQLLRKEAGLSYNDRIVVKYSTDSERLLSSISKHMEYIMNETRAVKLEMEKSITDGKEFDIDGDKIKIEIRKVNMP